MYLSIKVRKKGVTLFLSLILFILSSITESVASDQSPIPSSPFSIAVYAGPASPTPLLNLVQLKKPTLAPYGSLTSALNYPIFSNSKYLAIELEGSISFYSEGIDRTSFQQATLFRWLATPWNKVVQSSLAIGVGLSYALSAPQVEVDVLPKTSNLLTHLVFEFAADLDRTSIWQGLFRIHHRSGAYGLFDGVVGGSDYLCLGIRKKF